MVRVRTDEHERIVEGKVFGDVVHRLVVRDKIPRVRVRVRVRIKD